MRIKFLSIMMVAAVVLTFISCDNKDKTSSDSESNASVESPISDDGHASGVGRDSSASESNESAGETGFDIKDPTGDAAQDAKYVTDKIIDIYSKDINSDEDAFKRVLYQAIVNTKYTKFYEEKGPEEFKKYTDEIDKLINQDPEYSKKLIEVNQMIKDNQEKASRYLKEPKKDYDAEVEKQIIDANSGEVTHK